MASEDRHDEDLFPPEPSREEVPPSGEEEEEFFVLEEEEEEPGGEEGIPQAEGAVDGGPSPGSGPGEEVPEGGDVSPVDDPFSQGDIDESLFADSDDLQGETPETVDGGTFTPPEAAEPVDREDGDPEIYVEEPLPGEDRAVSAGGDEEQSSGGEPEEAPEDILFDDLDEAGGTGEDFGVDLPSFQEEGGGEEGLLEALEEFDPEAVHDAPRGGGDPSLEEMDDLDLDLDAELELVDEVEDLVQPGSGKEESPEESGEEALELVLEDEEGPRAEAREMPARAGEEELVLEGMAGDEESGIPELELDGEGDIDESLFEGEESPAEPMAAAQDEPSREEIPVEESPSDSVGEEIQEGEESPGTIFQGEEEVGEEAPMSPLLTDPGEGAPPEAAGESQGAPSGVAPWMVPEEVLEETSEGLAAVPPEESLMGGEEGGGELPEIGLRPLEEEEPYAEGEEEDSWEEAAADGGESPTFEELYGLPPASGESGGEVETSDSIMVEAPKVVGSIYQEEEHGWGVKLILWGSLAASFLVAAFVGWVYMKQKARLERTAPILSARVEMPRPVLPDNVPPPDLRPREQTAWKAYQGPQEPPPPPASQVARGEGTGDGSGGKKKPVSTRPVVPLAGENPFLPPLLAGGSKPGEGEAGHRKPAGEEVKPTKVEGPGTPSGGAAPTAQAGSEAGPGKGRETKQAPPAQTGPEEPGKLAKASPGGEVPVPAVPAVPNPQAKPTRPAGPAQPSRGEETHAAPPPSSGPSPREKGWKDAMGLVRGTQVLAELKNGNYFIGRIYKIGGRKVILDVKKGQLTFYYDEVAHLMPIGPALARKLKEHPHGFVILKNTNRLKGEIVVEAKDFVTIQVREARITIPRESIERVEKGEETSLKLTEDPVLARELGMEDIPVEDEGAQAKAEPAPASREEPSIPSGAVEELDRLLGATRNRKEEEKGRNQVLTLPSPKEGAVKVKAGD